MRKIVENVKFIQDGTLVFGDLYLEDGYVERINYKTQKGSCDLAIPALVDMHTHGFQGIDCETCDIDDLRMLARNYAKRGVTTFCPTLHALKLSEYIPYLEAYRKAFSSNDKGAKYAGAHLEGPYLNPKLHGSMDPNNFCKIDMFELQEFLKEYHKDIKVMTIAPELDHALEAIHLLHLYGIEVSIGHSEASYEQMIDAFNEGANQITHLFNTMPDIDHHKRNLVDAIFNSNCMCEIIMDGVHIQNEMVDWVLKVLGSHRILAISDGTRNTGLDGRRDLLDIFRNLYSRYGLFESVRMCSKNGAQILKTYSHDISLGRKIDLLILDHDLNLKDVIMDGRSLYE